MTYNQSGNSLVYLHQYVQAINMSLK